MRRLALVFGAAILLRAVVHVIVFRDGVALGQIALLDLGAFVLMVISLFIGPVAGRAFAGVTLFALAVGLPLAGIGAAFDLLLGSMHLSEMSSFVGLAAIGAGLAGVGPWHALVGAAMAVGGTYGLTQIHDPLESLLVAAPILLAYTWLLVEMTRDAKRPDPE